jgi:ketosteroid isomerase-like protein
MPRTRQVSRGYAGLVDEYKHDYPTRAAMGTLAFTDLEVRPLTEDFAVVIGKYHLDRNKKEGGPAEGIFSLVFEKTDKGWKIIIDHTT